METKDVVLENSLLRVAFDPATGAVVEMVSKATGWRIHRRRDKAMPFRLLAPMPERRFNLVEGAEQKPPKVETKGKTEATFTWTELVSRLETKLKVTLRLRARLDRWGLTFTVEVENGSKMPIETVDWPCIGDLSTPGPKEPLDRLTRGYGSMDRRTLLPILCNTKGYFGTDYPMLDDKMYGPGFVLMSTPKQGLYAGLHDPKTRQLIKWNWDMVPGYRDTAFSEPLPANEFQLRFYVNHFLYVPAGGHAVSQPIVLRPYVGDWHAGADCYREWRKTYHKPPQVAAWVKDVHSWQQLHINCPEDDLRVEYRHLVKYGEDCAKHGVKAIQLVGWNYGGQDRGNPFHDFDPRLGTWEEMKEAIEAINKMGVKIVLFAKFAWLDRSTPWYKSRGHKLATKDPYGDAHYHPGYQYQTPAQLGDINPRRFSPTCWLNPEWQEMACDEFRKCLALTIDGILYDEILSHGPSWMCFDPNHGHPVPVCVPGGNPVIADRFKEIADKETKRFLFAGEEPPDNVGEVYSLSYTRIDGNHLPFQRYYDPDIQIMVAVHGYDDREKIHQALMYRYVMSYEPLNFKGRLDDFPKTIAYGKLVDAFRRRHRAYLWDNVECLDTLGAKVDGGCRYSVLRRRSDGKRAVVLANQSGEPVVAGVKLDGRAKLLVATPEDPVPRTSKGQVHLPPRSAAVLMEA